MSRTPQVFVLVFVLLVITMVLVDSRIGRIAYLAADEFSSDDLKQTRVVVVFKQSQRPVANAIVEIYHDKKFVYTARTNADGLHIVPRGTLDAQVSYYFTVRVAGYRREADGSVQGGTILLELTTKYGPRIPED